MNTTADHVVARERAVAAPRGPKAVWLPCPPKAAATSPALAALQQHHDDQKQANQNMNYVISVISMPVESPSQNEFGAEGGI